MDLDFTHRIDGVHDVPLGAGAPQGRDQNQDQHDAEEGAVRGRKFVEIERVWVG